MRAESKYIDQVDAAIMAAYAASTDDRSYAMLAESLTSWDEEVYPDKGKDEARLAEELYKLMTFLEKKGLKRQSDQVFRAMLLTFPEQHFAQSPSQIKVEGIDLSLFKKIDSESMKRFEDCYRMALADLQKLAHEIDMRQFREECVGLAGSLFAAFVAVAAGAAESEHRDVPWLLMHQLAWQLNNVDKSYNEAYGILRSLLSLKSPAPGEQLAVELDNSMRFFKRNHYWNRIDKASMTGDTATMAMYIDRLMPMVTAGHEKSNLVMLRAKAVKKDKELPWGCLLLLTAIILGAFAIDRLAEAFKLQGVEQPVTTTTTTLLPSDPTGTIPQKSGDELASISLQVFNRAGLDESKPPPQPLGRKLTLNEVRYVIFQKQRLEHLEGIELSEAEKELLYRLWEEWHKRSDNAEFDQELKDQVASEAQLLSDSLAGDAIDQLDRLSKILKPDDWKKNNETTSEDDDSDGERTHHQRSEGLLNLQDPDDIRKTLEQLEKKGYYNGPLDLMTWNSVARSALARFKAAKMLRTDTRWDIETQQALFSDP
ncbi:MAG: hypothetical protein GQF41_2217 [Candidatus Rifleibacterium amylolyticum]|nr:MAG: hypothetical protein GQF41_2217 [Candidatus Rifleibacterium amylolyticum]